MQYILQLLIILITSSCFHQTPSPTVKRNELYSRANSQSCAKANLKTNLADQQNTIYIFECIGWDKEFSEIYKIVKNLPQVEYASIANILNQSFFSTKEDKDKLFELLTKYGKKDKFQSMISLMHLALGPKLLNVIHDIVKETKEIEWVSLLSDQDINKKSVETIFHLKRNLKLSYKDIHKYHALYNSNEYQVLQTNLLDQFIKSISNNDGLKAIANFSYFNGWPYSWMQQLKDDEFEKLFFYVSSFKKSTLENTRFLRKQIFKKVVCNEYSGKYVFHHGKELRYRVQNIVDMNIDEFYADYIDLLQSFSLFKNVCNQTYINDSKIAKLIDSTDELFEIAHQTFAMHGGFELIKNIVRVTLDDSLESGGAMMELMHSAPFMSYVDLVKFLDKSAEGKKYFSKWIKVLKNIDPDFLQLSSELLSGIVKEKYYSTTFYNFWNRLSHSTKASLRIELVDFLLHLKDQENNFYLFKELEEVYPEFLKLENVNQNDLNSVILYLSEQLKDEKVQKELKIFLSEKSFFQLIRLMGSVRSETVTKRPNLVRNHVRYVMNANDDLESCFNWIGEKLKNGVNFWDLLDRYPKKCEQRVGNYLSTHVLNWTIIIDEHFYVQTGRKFSVPYGVIAPEMMEYYLDLVMLVNKYLDKSDGHLDRVVSDIQRHLFDYGLVEVIDSVAKVTKLVNDKTNFVSSALYKVSIRDSDLDINLEKDFKSYAKDVLSIKEVQAPQMDSICSSLNSSVLEYTCINKEVIGNYVDRLSFQLLAKNWANQDPLQLMISLFYPKEGVKIPYNRRYIKYFHMTLDQLVRFLYDISDPSTNKEIRYLTQNSSFLINTTLVDRLEMLIREISFLDNFYGAYFMNTVARAKNYNEKVSSLKKKMKLLNTMGNTMRSAGLLPKESRWMMHNAMSTYDSLFEVAQNFKQPEGNQLSHKDFIQALMVMVVESTNSQANSFTAYRIPRAHLVKDHRGKIITMSTELSLLTRGAKYLRRFYPNKEDIIYSRSFQEVSSKLPTLMSYESLYDLSKFVLKSENTKLFIQDTFDFFESLKPAETKELFELIGSFIRLSSSNNKYVFDNYVSFIKTFFRRYHVIRELFQIKDLSINLQKLLNFSNITENYKKKESFNYVVKIVKELVDQNIDEINTLLEDSQFWLNLNLIMNSLDVYNENNSDEFSDFLIKILNDSKLDFKVFDNLVKKVYLKENSLEYFDQLVSLMALNSYGRTNIYYCLDEVFRQKELPLINFLKVIVGRVSYDKLLIKRLLSKKRLF